MATTSRRPYLIRAIYQWALDNDYTPHLLVAADAPGVEVPRDTMSEGKLALNIGPTAVRDLHLGDDHISFNARFGGRPFAVNLPPGTVLALYASETGEGVVFGEVEPPPDDPNGLDDSTSDGSTAPRKKGPPHLKVVK